MHRETVRSETYSGPLPLPPPMALEQYRDIDPTLVQWMKDAADEQRRHRFEMERAQVEDLTEFRKFVSQNHRDRHERASRGQHYALVVTIAGFGLAALALALGHPTAAVLITGGALATIVTAFLWGRKREEKDAEPDAPDEPNADAAESSADPKLPPG
jgi:uncharacterized membrane protein